jgi:outer membrane protein OmpA-like peptidoglycan-associated protein
MAGIMTNYRKKYIKRILHHNRIKLVCSDEPTQANNIYLTPLAIQTIHFMKTKSLSLFMMICMCTFISLNAFSQNLPVASADSLKGDPRTNEHKKYLSTEARASFEDIRNGCQSITKEINERFQSHREELNADEMPRLRKTQYESLLLTKKVNHILDMGFVVDDHEYRTTYGKIKGDYDSIIKGINDRLIAKQKNADDIKNGENGFLYQGVLIKSIYFDLNKATLRPSSMAELEKIQEIMMKDEALKLEIIGYTCQLGSKQYNLELSAKRNKTVSDWLIGHGIDKKRILFAQYGEDKPIASNDHEKNGRELNRRVEFRIL